MLKPTRTDVSLCPSRQASTPSPGIYTIAASLIGYAIARVNVIVRGAESPPIVLRLAEGAGTYTERVTVVGARPEESQAVPGAAALHGGELQNLRGVMLDDPLRAVQMLPSTTATDDFYSEFAVRGSAFRHVNLTVDGISARYLMHTVNDVVDGGSIAMINSETLGAVTLLPGSYPERTGRRIGAEVDLLTREGNRQRFSGRAGLSGTSATFLAEGPINGGRGSWLISARRSYLDYILKKIYPDTNLAFGFSDAQTKLVYDLSVRNQLHVILLGGRAAFSRPSEDLDLDDTASATSTPWLAIAGWRFTPSPAVSLTQRAYTRGINFENRNPGGVRVSSGGSTDVGWRMDGSYLASPHAFVEFGGDVERLQGRHDRLIRISATTLAPIAGFDRSTSTASGYGQATLTAGAARITPGVRIDRWRLTNDTLASPWVNGELRLGSRTTLRAGTGIYRQFPDLEQVYGQHAGGTGLQPERAVHIDAGIERSLGHETSLQVSGFARNESDVLWTPGSETRRLPSGAIEFGRIDAPWTNVLTGRGRGVEMMLRRDAATGVSGWLGYALARLRYATPAGEQFWSDADQRHTISAYVRYRLTNRTSVSGKYRYGSNYPLVGYLTISKDSPFLDNGEREFYALTTTRNGTRLAAYSRIDLRADHAFRWGSRRVVLFGEVANVLNHTNLRNRPYGIDRLGRAFFATDTLLPLVPSAGVVVEF